MSDLQTLGKGGTKKSKITLSIWVGGIKLANYSTDGRVLRYGQVAGIDIWAGGCWASHGSNYTQVPPHWSARPHRYRHRWSSVRLRQILTTFATVTVKFLSKDTL